MILSRADESLRESRRRRRLCIVIVVTACIAACDKPAQHSETGPAAVTAANYDLAEQWLPENISSLVRNISVAPVWIENKNRFWYCRETVTGHQFVAVDAASGVKAPAFDHEKLAAALEVGGIDDVDPEELPFSAFEFRDNESAIVFTVGDSEYRCGLPEGPCRVQSETAAAPGVLLSPDGKRGVRTRTGNLYLVDRKSGAETALTTDGEEHFGYGIYYGNWYASYIRRQRNGGDEAHPPMATHWAPDSRHLLTTRLDERHVEPYPFVVTVPPDGSFRPQLFTPRIPLVGEEPPRLEWYVIDTETGRMTRLDLPYDDLLHVHQDMHAIRKFWWSENYEHLYVAAYGDTIRSTHFFDIDLDTGDARQVIEDSTLPRSGFSSSTYDPPNVFLVEETQEIIWFSQQSGWGHLYLYDLATGALKNAVTAGDWLVRDVIRVDGDKRQIFFTGAGREDGNAYFRYLYSVNFDGSDLKLLTPEIADHHIESLNIDPRFLHGRDVSAAISPDGKYLVYDHSTVGRPTQSVVRRTDGDDPGATFEKADATALFATGWQSPEPFVAKAADGKTPVYGVLYKPHNLDTTRKYPVLDAQYASPLTAVVPHNFVSAVTGPLGATNVNAMTALGFASVVVDARGTTYRAAEFSHHSWKNLHHIGLDDHIAAIEGLAEKYAWIDIDRAGIHGSSYGGFATFRAMFDFPQFFKVGVASVPPAILHGLYPDYHWEAIHGEARYEEGARLKPSPDSVPVNYQNMNAVAEAGDLQGKLLILIGEIDENVFPASTLILVNRLIELDRDFDMFYYPNTAHGIRNMHSTHRKMDYFVEHLLGITPPDYTFGERQE